jgi:hypothetical protein
MVRILVIADEDGIQGEFGGEALVNGIHCGERLHAPGNIRLIRDYEEEKTGLLEVGQRLRDPRQDFEGVDGGGRIRFAVAYDGAVQDAIAVEEDGAAGRGVYRTDSHFVSQAFKSGWDTIRCHTTA